VLRVAATLEPRNTLHDLALQLLIAESVVFARRADLGTLNAKAGQNTDLFDCGLRGRKLAASLALFPNLIMPFNQLFPVDVLAWS
jgi:hypothetical protein